MDSGSFFAYNFFIYRKETWACGKLHSHVIMMPLFSTVSVKKEAEHESSVAKGSTVMLRGDVQTPTKGTEM